MIIQMLADKAERHDGGRNRDTRPCEEESAPLPVFLLEKEPFMQLFQFQVPVHDGITAFLQESLFPFFLHGGVLFGACPGRSQPCIEAVLCIPSRLLDREIHADDFLELIHTYMTVRHSVFPSGP